MTQLEYARKGIITDKMTGNRPGRRGFPGIHP